MPVIAIATAATTARGNDAALALNYGPQTSSSAFMTKRLMPAV